MHRRRLHTAMLLLGIGLACWASQVLGQGDGTEQKTPKIIATSRPANPKPAPTSPSDEPAKITTKIVKTDDLPLDNEAPPVPQPPRIPPVVPLPDDGLTPARPRTSSSRLQLRDLPPDAHTIRDPHSTKAPASPIITENVKAAVFTIPKHTSVDSDKSDDGGGQHIEDRSSPGSASSPIPPRFPDLPPSSDLVRADPPMSEGAQTAKVTVEVVGSSSITPGQTYSYEILVRNAGPAVAYDVHVSEVLAQSARYLSVEPEPVKQKGQLEWLLGNLQGGAERRIRIQLLPPAEGEFVSSARATFATVATLKAQASKTRLAISRLAISSENTDVVAVGGTARIPITVTNTSNTPAKHVKLQVQLDQGLQHPSGAHIEAEAGILAAGETRTFTLETKAVQAGQQVNGIRVQADDCPAVSTQAVLTVTDSSLQVQVKGPTHGAINQESEFHLEVTNPGATEATGIKLTTALPLGLEFVESEGATNTPGTRLVEWSLSRLPAGNTWNIALKLKGKTAGEHLLQSLVQADHGLKARAATPVRIEEGVTGVTMEVTAKDNPLEVGAETVYEIRVVNQGDAPCTNVSVIALAPDGLKPTQADGPALNRLQKQQITFEPLAQLQSRSEAKYLVYVKGQRPGDWRFKVQLTCDQLQRPITREEGTHVYND